MSEDIESIIRARVEGATGVTALYEVPSKRPSELVTVELTGETARERGIIRTATLDVCSWCDTRAAACGLCDKVRDALMGIDHPAVFRVSVASVFRDRALDGGAWRYHLVINVDYCA